jgi:hypothetical protein
LFKIFKKDARKRRSDRLMFAIPLRVEGKTETGPAFECAGSAIGVNRHGAQIQIEQSVSLGQKVRLTNLATGASGEFRIVKALGTSSEGRFDFGVEAIDSNLNLWGIHFPKRSKRPAESRALLKCSRCHTVSLMPLSLVDVEILESGGVLMKPCAACGARTPWAYAKRGQSTEASGGPPELGRLREAGSDLVTAAHEPQTAAVFVQRPVSLRTASGEVETVQTESTSEAGISCTSQKIYEVNQEATLRWTSPASGQKFEVKGRIVRRHDIGGSSRKIYSIRYESPVVLLPAVQPHGVGKLYLGFGTLLVMAAVLVEINIENLVSGFSAAARRWPQISGFALELLLICLGYKLWRMIQAREPEERRVLRGKHRVVAGAATAMFCAGLLTGAVRGLDQRRERGDARKFLLDLDIANLLEKNIDAAENRVLDSPVDYADACSTLELLSPRWSAQIERLLAEAAELREPIVRRGGKASENVKRLDDILDLDLRKAQLVREQIALMGQANDIPPEKQAGYWQTHFQPLRQEILDLDARKSDLLHLLVAEK